MKKDRLFLYLAFFYVIALLPILILRDYTPSNELRYLSIADEALRNGNLFTFTNQGEPYADKPPLYLWFIMLGKVLWGGHHMWFLSLFSMLPALGILFVMDRWARPWLDDRNRLTAFLILMTCGLFLGLAVILRMDMLMCLFITLALYYFWRIYTNEGDKTSNQWLFPLWVFLALFSKGPVGVLVPLLSTLVFLAIRKQLKTIGKYWGWRTWTLLGAGCALWFTCAWLEGGSEYLNNLLFHQTIDRAVDAFHHKEPFWYYLVSMWYSLAPWSFLIIGVIIVALVRRMKLADLEVFFLTIILTTLGMLSVFSSKIAVYLAPTFPFFVYLTVLLMGRMRVTGWMRIAAALPAFIGTIAPFLLFFLIRRPDCAFLNNHWCIAASVILFFIGIKSFILLSKQKAVHKAIQIEAAGILLALFVGGFSLPKLNAELGYGNLCREVKQITAGQNQPTIYVWKIHRPESMDVYLGQDITIVRVDEILSGKCTPGSLLLLSTHKLAKQPELQQYLMKMPQHSCGRYLIVEITPQFTPFKIPSRIPKP